MAAPPLTGVFPAPAKDFDAVTAKLAEIRTSSLLADGRYFPASGEQGWRLRFNSNATISAQGDRDHLLQRQGCGQQQLCLVLR